MRRLIIGRPCFSSRSPDRHAGARELHKKRETSRLAGSWAARLLCETTAEPSATPGSAGPGARPPLMSLWPDPTPEASHRRRIAGDYPGATGSGLDPAHGFACCPHVGCRYDLPARRRGSRTEAHPAGSTRPAAVRPEAPVPFLNIPRAAPPAFKPKGLGPIGRRALLPSVGTVWGVCAASLQHYNVEVPAVAVLPALTRPQGDFVLRPYYTGLLTSVDQSCRPQRLWPHVCPGRKGLAFPPRWWERPIHFASKARRGCLGSPEYVGNPTLAGYTLRTGPAGRYMPLRSGPPRDGLYIAETYPPVFRHPIPDNLNSTVPAREVGCTCLARAALRPPRCCRRVVSFRAPPVARAHVSEKIFCRVCSASLASQGRKILAGGIGSACAAHGSLGPPRGLNAVFFRSSHKTRYFSQQVACSSAANISAHRARRQAVLARVKPSTTRTPFTRLIGSESVASPPRPTWLCPTAGNSSARERTCVIVGPASTIGYTFLRPEARAVGNPR